MLIARTAVGLDNRDSEAHLLLAWTYLRAKANFDLAASQVDSAIKLNPKDCNNYCFKSWLLTCSGDLDAGIQCANEALRRNPMVHDDCFYTIGFAEYLAGRYEQALFLFRQMNPSTYLEVSGWMAACYAELDRNDDARQLAEEFLHRAQLELTESPTQSADSWRAYWERRVPFKDLAKLDTLLNSLRKAGLPD